MFQKKFCSDRKVSKGFTLVEIIVVLVILAILAAATIPSLLGFIKDTKYASLDNEASAVRIAAQAYATENFAKGVADSDIESAIYGTIKPGHALYSLLQNDVNGMIYEPKVENGKIKGFKYTKAVVEGEGEDFISDKDVQLTKFDLDKSTFVHATERITSVNMNAFRENMIADVIEALTSDESFKSSLTSSLTTDLNSNLESGMNSKIAALKINFKTELGSNVVDLIYPVGSFYVSYNSTSPATLFGGTWTQITDRFLYCANSSGKTGGEATHTLTEDEMPSHDHGLKMHKSGDEATGYSLLSASAGVAGGFMNGVIVRGGISNIADWKSHLTGGGAAHNNMPPYLTVYCWRRTA